MDLLSEGTKPINADKAMNYGDRKENDGEE
jgi:hypothetical protein